MAEADREKPIYFGRQFAVSRQDREWLNAHKSKLLWFTGLPRSGKSTLADGVEQELHARGYRTFVLDGDNIRQGLNKDLGFSAADRVENIRRIAEVSRLFVEAGIITLCAFISPFRADRESIKQLHGEQDFIEIYCHCPVEICEQRDSKGLYARARTGVIKNFTGVSSPYEPPEHPDLEVRTDQQTVAESVARVIQYLQTRAVING